MHQIRIHLASEGYPILGDLIYGTPAINRKLGKVTPQQRQLLHCWNYCFTDHTRKSIDITAPVPEDFIKVFPSVTSYE
jgi:23S rRNA-/tRNA-specific pseudouridylate synthase